MLAVSGSLISCETAPPKRTTQRQDRVFARVTVYWTNSDRWTRRHQSSTGTRLHVGHVAVDPRKIPYGSKVIFPDGEFTAVDTGTAVKSRKAARKGGRTLAEKAAIVIDRFFETKREALHWARSNPLFQNLEVVYP